MHVYVSDDALQNAYGGRPVELVEELGVVDPLMDSSCSRSTALQRWEPAGRTYVDQIGALLAAHLGQQHAAGLRPSIADRRGRSAG